MSKSRYRNGHRDRGDRAYWRSLGLPCALCHRPIDYGLPAGLPGSFEIDHIVPIGRGGGYERSNQQPAHRWCNQHKSDKLECEMVEKDFMFAPPALEVVTTRVL